MIMDRLVDRFFYRVEIIFGLHHFVLSGQFVILDLILRSRNSRKTFSTPSPLS